MRDDANEDDKRINTGNQKKLKMSFIISVKGVLPQFGNNCFIAPNATIAGDVVMGNDCSIWFNA